MTKAKRNAVTKYLNVLQAHMELRDWDVAVSEEECENDYDARIYLTYGRKLARIVLSPDFLSGTPEEQRHTLVHELVHCHLEPACNMVQNDLQTPLNKSADMLFWAGFRRQMEYGVDALACALAPHMPLPAYHQPR